jgi:hypothetical protein
LVKAVLPRADARKLALLALAAALAGCGGGKAHATQRIVHGNGYAVGLPTGWTVSRSARGVQARDGASIVSVTTFTLVRRYRPQLFPKVTRELDATASQLAAVARGKLAKSETLNLAGGPARAYTIDLGKGEERIGFVLSGKREYQLYCRYDPGSDAEAACSTLFSSFRLA